MHARQIDPPLFIHVTRSGVSQMLPHPSPVTVREWDAAAARARLVGTSDERGR